MITVVIPALNESKTIGSVVRTMRKSPRVSEVIVVDDGSIDGTPEVASSEGATVVTSSFLGKGASMQDGASVARNEYLLFMDGDLTEFVPDLAERMTRPLVSNLADYVKARFTRSGGRVTELAAKPLLKVFFPELLHIDQPLGGVVATRKSLLRSLKFENDYGVDIGLLIDMFAKEARILQVDIGFIEHDCQPLESLRRMASQVTRTILDRARRLGRLTESQVIAVHEQERQDSADLESTIQRLGSPEKLALIDMDGTLIKGRFVDELAKAVAKEHQLASLLDNKNLSARVRTERIAAIFEGTPQEVFQNVAMKMPLTKGAAELVVGLRKRGYAVGIISDSYYIATEVIRRRVFADFSMAHLLRFVDGRANGDISISPAMQHDQGCQEHPICKQNVLQHILEQLGYIPRILAIGDNDGDACLLQAADLGIAFEPKTRHVASCANQIIRRNVASALNYMDHEFEEVSSQWLPPFLASKISGDGLF